MLQHADRYNIPVGAKRAYVAGFGTSGSLLAAAAVLFLVGSAIVAFNGWPQIGAPAATSNVAAAPVAATSRASRRLIHALAATRQRVAASGAVVGARPNGARGHGRVAGRTVAREGAPMSNGGQGGGGGTPSSGAAASSPATASNACSGCSQQASGSPSPAATVTNKIAKTVSTVGNDVGSQITGISGTAGSQLGKVSPPVGNTVAGAGSAVGSTVSGATTTATNAVSGVGNTVTGVGNTVTSVGNPLGGGH